MVVTFLFKRIFMLFFLMLNFSLQIVYDKSDILFGIRTIAPRLGLGFGLGLVLGLEAIFLGGNCPRTIYFIGSFRSISHNLSSL